MRTKQENINLIHEIFSRLNHLEESELLNHPSLPKIWEGLREIKKFVEEKEVKK